MLRGRRPLPLSLIIVFFCLVFFAAFLSLKSLVTVPLLFRPDAPLSKYGRRGVSHNTPLDRDWETF